MFFKKNSQTLPKSNLNPRLLNGPACLLFQELPDPSDPQSLSIPLLSPLSSPSVPDPSPPPLPSPRQRRAAPSTCSHVAPVPLASHIAAPIARSIGRMGGGGEFICRSISSPQLPSPFRRRFRRRLLPALDQHGAGKRRSLGCRFLYQVSRLSCRDVE